MGPAASDRPKLGLVSLVSLTLLASAELGASCVDGVTPDCSDPAVCAPDQGAATGDRGVAPEAGADAGAELDASSADADGG